MFKADTWLMASRRPLPSRPDASVDTDEAARLFADLHEAPALLLAISGGVDSMALLWLAAAWRRTLPAGPDLHIATVDHGLRPDSAVDVAFVADAAERLSLPCHRLAWSGPKPTTGRQVSAREARYGLLASTARGLGAAIVTAHTQDDQAETVLMRLARGSGPDGLGAMAPRSSVLGVPLLRPLLDVPKSRLKATLARAGVVWREDPSNANEAFERVRLRRLGEGRAALGLSDERLALAARRARRATSALDEIAREQLRRFVGSSALSRWGVVELPRPPFGPVEVELRVLRLAIGLAGDGEQRTAFAPDGPELAELERLQAALRRPSWRGATLGRARLALRGGAVIVLRESGRETLPAVSLAPGGTAMWDGRWSVVSDARAPSGMVRQLDRGDDLPGAGEALPAMARATLPVFVGDDGCISGPGDKDGGSVRFRAKLLDMLTDQGAGRADEGE